MYPEWQEGRGSGFESPEKLKKLKKLKKIKTSSEMLTVEIDTYDSLKSNIKDSALKFIEKVNKRIILYIDHM